MKGPFRRFIFHTSYGMLKDLKEVPTKQKIIEDFRVSMTTLLNEFRLKTKILRINSKWENNRSSNNVKRINSKTQLLGTNDKRECFKGASTIKFCHA